MKTMIGRWRCIRRWWHMIRVDILKLETTGACNTLPHPLLSAPGAAPGRMKKSCAWQSGVCGKGSRLVPFLSDEADAICVRCVRVASVKVAPSAVCAFSHSGSMFPLSSCATRAALSWPDELPSARKSPSDGPARLEIIAPRAHYARQGRPWWPQRV